jgi:hypothetical protein
MWLWGGLVSVLFGAIIMAMGSTFNPKKHSGMSSRTPSEFGSTAVSIEDSMESTYKSMMGAGVAVLLAGEHQHATGLLLHCMTWSHADQLVD